MSDSDYRKSLPLDAIEKSIMADIVFKDGHRILLTSSLRYFVSTYACLTGKHKEFKLYY